MGVQSLDAEVTVGQTVDGSSVLRWSDVELDWGMRVQGQRVAVWTPTGKISVVDHAERSTEAAFTLR